MAFLLRAYIVILISTLTAAVVTTAPPSTTALSTTATPATAAPTTLAPTTTSTTTAAPTTLAPTTLAPTTTSTTTVAPTTAAPTTTSTTTAAPTTAAPTTSSTTLAPTTTSTTTAAPTTSSTTLAPTTTSTTTAAPTTAAPTTSSTTLAPTTTSTTTAAPTTAAPTTLAPTTLAPTTAAPTTSSTTTAAPTTAAPTTLAPTTAAPTTSSTTTAAPTTLAPTTSSTTTAAPTTLAPTTVAPMTLAPTTSSTTTAAPTTLAPTTTSPMTAAPTPASTASPTNTSRTTAVPVTVKPSTSKMLSLSVTKSLSDGCASRSATSPSHSLTVLYPVVEFVQAPEAVAAAAATTFLSVSALLSGPDISNANIQAMLSLLSCTVTPASLRAQSSSMMYVVSPFYRQGGIAMLIGNLGLIFAVAIGNFLGAFAHSRMRGCSLVVSMGGRVIQCPAWALRAALFLTPGAVYGAILLIATREVSGGMITLGSVGVIGVCAGIAKGQHWFVQHVLGCVSWESFSDGSLVPDGFLGRCLLPYGAWSPKQLRISYGPAFSVMGFPFERWRIAEVLLSLVTAAVSGIGGAVQGRGCTAAVATLSCLYGVAAVLTAVLRVYRAPHHRVTSPLQYALFCAQCACKWADMESPAALSLAMSSLIALRLVCDAYVSFRLEPRYRTTNRDKITLASELSPSTMIYSVACSPNDDDTQHDAIAEDIAMKQTGWIQPIMAEDVGNCDLAPTQNVANFLSYGYLDDVCHHTVLQYNRMDDDDDELLRASVPIMNASNVNL